MGVMFVALIVGAIVPLVRADTTKSPPDRELLSVDALREMMKHEDPYQRHSAICKVMLNSRDKEYLQQLAPATVAMINDPEPFIRALAAEALGEFTDFPDIVVPKLIEALDDPFPRVREAACISLAYFDEMAKEAVPKLLVFLESDERAIWKDAVYTLGWIGSASEPAVERISELSSDSDPELRREAVAALGRIGTGDGKVVAALVRCLSDENVEVKYEARMALPCLGEAGFSALLKGWRGDVSDVIAAAEEAPISNSDVVAGIARVGLRSRNITVRYWALQYAHFYLDNMILLFPDYVEIVKKGDPVFRGQAAYYLTSDLDDTKYPLNQLLQLADDQDSFVRYCIGECIAAWGEEGLSMIREAIGDKRETVRSTAAESLTFITPHDNAVVSLLIGLLNDESPIVRKSAANSLGRIGKPAEKARDALEKLKNDKDKNVRESVERTLRKFGPVERSDESS